MPKVIGTRRQKAAELLRMLESGPSMDRPAFGRTPFTPGEAKRQYKLWCESWVIPLVNELVPELRKKKGDNVPDTKIAGKTP